MLVIVSDLHFTDGTSSHWSDHPDAPTGRRDDFNLKPSAFRLFFSDLADTVRRNPTIEAVKIVYAGDIFDLLRTYAWFQPRVHTTPWSIDPSDDPAIAAFATEFLQNIVRHNAESLAWLSGKKGGEVFDDFASVWPDRVPIERVYIPGNHDRLVNRYDACRKLASEALLGQATAKRFPNQITDDRHRTIVLHGHEADAFNCELREGAPDYDAVPIGDPMTTMLFTRLGYEAQVAGLDADLVAELREVDNVRPELDAVRYVQRITSKHSARAQLAAVIAKVVEAFRSLAFYDQWRARHDHWGFDEADKLEAALRAVSCFGTHIPVGPLEWIPGIRRPDECERLAFRRLTESPAAYDHCVLGHTHEPFHRPISAGPGGEKHYLNSGTFRSTFARTATGDDFVQFQRMSYVVIYAPGELSPADQGPLWEMWSGTRRRV